MSVTVLRTVWSSVVHNKRRGNWLTRNTAAEMVKIWQVCELRQRHKGLLLQCLYFTWVFPLYATLYVYSTTNILPLTPRHLKGPKAFTMSFMQEYFLLLNLSDFFSVRFVRTSVQTLFTAWTCHKLLVSAWWMSPVHEELNFPDISYLASSTPLRCPYKATCSAPLVSFTKRSQRVKRRILQCRTSYSSPVFRNRQTKTQV